MIIRFLFVIFLFGSLSVRAHQSSVAFLSLKRDSGMLDVRWEIALRDLEFAAGLDKNGDSKITWGEVREKLSEVSDYALRRISLQRTVDPQISFEQRTTGAYLVFQWRAPEPSAISYDFLFDLDPSHQCVVELPDGESTVLMKDHRTVELRAPAISPVRNFFGQGVTHIFAGIDHLCFLLALLLPSVWRRTSTGWESIGTLRSAALSVLRIVTSFTVAHSITLALAAGGWVRLPSVFVESVIAASVIVAAANNLYPIWDERSWMVSFGFGLMHGFGFASVLGELGLRPGALASSLFAFNLGVEAGQLAIVAAFLPLAFWLRQTAFYRGCVFRFGSAAIVCVAGVWFIERAFQVAIF